MSVSIKGGNDYDHRGIQFIWCPDDPTNPDTPSNISPTPIPATNVACCKRDSLNSWGDIIRDVP